MDKKLKKEALEFSAFITDIAEVMQKHKVSDTLVVFEMNDKVRNTYIPLDKEKEIYCNISDGINEWLQLHRGYTKKIKPKKP